MSEVQDFATKSAIQQGLRSGFVQETPTTRLLRETMVTDPLIDKFLSGELFTVLDSVVKWVRAGKENMRKELYEELLSILKLLYEEWKRTKPFRPYLLLLSHLTSLTNLSVAEGKKYRRKIDILVSRDLIVMEETASTT